MAEGLDESVDVALFVGYHAPAGHEGVLAHTFSGLFTQVRINGRPASEMTVNALWAASMGVPVGLVTGDDVICRLAEMMLPGVTTVAVKTSHGSGAANTMPPSVARDAVRAGAKRAVESIDATRVIPVPHELHLEIDMPNATAAELAAGVPGVRVLGDRTIAREVASADELLGLITVSYSLAHLGALSRLALVNRR
jgi:D-amino peptidase